MKIIVRPYFGKPNAIEERNSFGIILPENQKTETKVCGYWSKVKELKVGDTVPQVLGVPYTEDGVDYLILSEGSDNPRRADVEFRISNQ
jgi:co-chaperonin GroES (HSP10)